MGELGRKGVTGGSIKGVPLPTVSREGPLIREPHLVPVWDFIVLNEDLGREFDSCGALAGWGLVVVSEGWKFVGLRVYLGLLGENMDSKHNLGDVWDDDDDIENQRPAKRFLFLVGVVPYLSY